MDVKRLPEVLDNEIHLEEPDMEVKRKERLLRTKEALQKVAPSVTHKIFPQSSGREEWAATCIQARYRGYQARKLYLDLLYEQYQREYNEQRDRMMQQVEEGQALVDSHRLEVLMEEESFSRRNKQRLNEAQAITIQRAWREYRYRRSQPMSLTTSMESNPGNQDIDAGNQHNNNELTLPTGQQIETDPSSTISDYSELNECVREHLANVHIIQKEDLQLGNALQDPELQKQARKQNLLSLAQEFANLKKLNSETFPAHNAQIQNRVFDDSELLQNTFPHIAPMQNFPQRSEHSSENVGNSMSNLPSNDALNGQKSQDSTLDTSHPLSHIREPPTGPGAASEWASQAPAGSREDAQAVRGPDFEVYTLPEVDWAALESQLQRAAQEEEQKQAQRSDREQILRRLAMDSTDDNFIAPSYRRTSLQSRLHSSQSLQVCYMNQEEEEQEGSLEASTRMRERSNTTQAEVHVSGGESLKPSQSRQVVKKSPMSDLVGIPDGSLLTFNLLETKNVAQLQILLNDLHGQIQGLNEDLVAMLEDRDQLHMEQDSMLTDVEDFQRWAQEMGINLHELLHMEPQPPSQ